MPTKNSRQCCDSQCVRRVGRASTASSWNELSTVSQGLVEATTSFICHLTVHSCAQTRHAHVHHEPEREESSSPGPEEAHESHTKSCAFGTLKLVFGCLRQALTPTALA